MCVQKGKPYVGVCYSQMHKDILVKHITNLIFRAFQTPGDPLYESDVMEVVKKDGKDSSGSSSTVPAKKPKIAAAKKEAASATASSAEALLFSELNKLDEE